MTDNSRFQNWVQSFVFAIWRESSDPIDEATLSHDTDVDISY